MLAREVNRLGVPCGKRLADGRDLPVLDQDLAGGKRLARHGVNGGAGQEQGFRRVCRGVRAGEDG